MTMSKALVSNTLQCCITVRSPRQIDTPTASKVSIRPPTSQQGISHQPHIREGLQIDKAGLGTKIQSQMDKTNDFYVKARMTQAS